METDQQTVQFSQLKYSSNSSIQAVQIPDVINIINRLDIEQTIKSYSINVYYQLCKERHDCKIFSVKGIQKLSLIFYCVYMGFIKSGNVVDPFYAAEIVKLPAKNVNRALNSYTSPGCTLYQPEEVIPFYINQLNNHCKKIGLSFEYQRFHDEAVKILNICRSTEAGKIWILQTSTRIVSITVVYFFLLDIIRVPIEKFEKIFETVCYSTKASIKRYYTTLCEIYNTIDTNSSEKNKLPFDPLTMFD